MNVKATIITNKNKVVRHRVCVCLCVCVCMISPIFSGKEMAQEEFDSNYFLNIPGDRKGIQISQVLMFNKLSSFQCL